MSVFTTHPRGPALPSFPTYKGRMDRLLIWLCFGKPRSVLAIPISLSGKQVGSLWVYAVARSYLQEYKHTTKRA